MNTLRKFKAQKITMQTRQIINIDGKAEFMAPSSAFGGISWV